MKVDRADLIAAEATSAIVETVPPDLQGDAAGLIQAHCETPNQEPSESERQEHAQDVQPAIDSILGAYRSVVERLDTRQKPYVRIVGRVMHLLTTSPRKPSCTLKPIIAAFLLQLPDELELRHRQHGRDHNTIYVGEEVLYQVFITRLTKLRDEWKLVKKDSTKGFTLSSDGRLVFREWPAHIQVDADDPNLWKRKKGVRNDPKPKRKRPTPGKSDQPPAS